VADEDHPRRHGALEAQSKGLKLALDKLRAEVHKLEEGYTEETHQLLDHWNRMQKDYSGDEYRYKVRGKEFKVPLNSVTLSGTKIPKVALPKWQDPAEAYTWLRDENLPGLPLYRRGVSLQAHRRGPHPHVRR
jgi:methylmalonyl-CoA mutase